MVLAFCRRGSVIPICLYLLVGRYMKERLMNESSKTKRTGLFQRMRPPFLPNSSCPSLSNLSLFWIRIEDLMAE